MRHEKEKILKEELRFLAIKTRDRLEITQREMSSMLEMSESSYSDIETGESMCGTLTAVLLLGMQSDPKDFIESTGSKLRDFYEKEMHKR